MSRVANLSRRDFLKASAAATGALVLGFRIGQTAQAAAAADIIFNPNAWLEINGDGEVIIQVPWSELGQGALTAVPMLLADELGVDFAAVQVVKGCIQLHGGIGFTWESDCQFYYRRARLLTLALGAKSHWADVLVRSLEQRNTMMAG